MSTYNQPPSFDISAPSTALLEQLRDKIDGKTKPIGSLGRLEDIALQIGLIQNTLSPCIAQPKAFVFAGDHGLSLEGVSPYPREVTKQMVGNFLAGGAAINVFAQQQGVDLVVVNCGLAEKFTTDAKNYIDCGLGSGTYNSLHTAAMSKAQLKNGLERGSLCVAEAIGMGSNLLCFGEMGIGNSSAAALIIAILTDLDLGDLVCAGAGHDSDGVDRKLAVLRKVFSRHRDIDCPLEVVQKVGGFEMVVALGGILKAAEQGATVMIDGYIMSAVALCAIKLYPNIRDFLIFSHLSASSGHRLLMNKIGVKPLLDLGMRLGEGTGCLLALPIVSAAVGFLTEMASFQEAGVAQKGV